MLLFKVNSIVPRKSRVFLMIITSQDRIVDLVLNERGHQGTELASFQPYRVFYLDISTGILSSVSFFSSDLPHESIVLPLFTNTTEDFFQSENENKACERIIVTVSMIDKINPFNEEDLRFSLDNQYKVDEEPLISMGNNESISDRESMVNTLFSAQTNTYKKVLENEKETRKKLEILNEEMTQKFEEKLKEFQKRETELQCEISGKEEKIHSLYGEIIKFRLSEKQLIMEKIQAFDIVDKLKAEVGVKNELRKEANLYKELLESMNNKWSDLSNKLENNYDTDPIHFIIKEKDEKILELTSKVSSNLMEIEIENELTKRKLSFSKENEVLYSLAGTKIVMISENGVLFYRKVSGLQPFNEFPLSSPQKRSNSAVRADVSKSLSRPIFKPSNPLSSGRSFEKKNY